ncbi:MAG: GTP-binding protein, partial [Deltaproteobacteria bacterium]|nr:GTP-binding protein [Deltaproteobacteria bacterium]
MKQVEQSSQIRNIAIIAHVDHGKTTLVDAMLRQSGTFRDGKDVDDRVMDSMDLERERGITIAAKNCSVMWDGVKINILDTPGHADFGGEVERALVNVDGAILLVDASEGPLPQTRFVLRKALEGKLRIVVVINKIDRKDARPQEVLNELYDLFIDLDANEQQIEFPVVYAIGREGIAMRNLGEDSTDLKPLFETILSEVPPPSYDPTQPFQMLVTNLSYSDYVGRLAIGRIFNGGVKQNESLVCVQRENKIVPLRAVKIQTYDGVGLKEVDHALPGDVVILAGIEDVEIGDTICTREAPQALKRIVVDEPTISMLFGPNTSPLAGRDGKFVQSRKIEERLQKEILHNVALHVESAPSGEHFIVKGRGEFQMAILIETMRREGYELTIGR